MTEIHALSGAYAVDALDELERAAFERHLAQCSECQAEVASLREAAALLGDTTAAAPPPALRDRILADITTVRPLPPETPKPQPSAPASDRSSDRSSDQSGDQPRRRWTTMLVAAAAVIVALGAGAVIWAAPWSSDSPSTTVSAAQQVLDADDAKSVSLDFPSGASATLTHSDSLGEAVLVTDDMPNPPDGKVYQLWLAQPGEGMVSAGVMPVKEDQTVLLDGDAATATGAGITVEPAGGSAQPTSKPIAMFDFGRNA